MGGGRENHSDYYTDYYRLRVEFCSPISCLHLVVLKHEVHDRFQKVYYENLANL